MDESPMSMEASRESSGSVTCHQKISVWLPKNPDAPCTAEPGSPTNFALTSLPAWNSAHQKSRKVTPSPSPNVNATRFDHIHDSWFSRIWFRHCKRKSHHSKKRASWRLNLNTMTDKSYWQRYIKRHSCHVQLHLHPAWFSCTWNMVFPLRTLQNSLPQLVGRRQLLANKS